MSQTSAGTSSPVYVTVASGSRRVDLVLPGEVPVAELVPELARSVGLLDATTVHGGYRLRTEDGRELAGAGGLAMQGVENGGLLTVSAGADDQPARVYDDVVEAMADVVEQDLTPWRPAAGRRTALWAAGLSLALGAHTLLLVGGTRQTAVAAAVIAILLLAAAIVLARAQAEPEAAVAVGWMAAGYAAVAAVLSFPGRPLEVQTAAAGAAALVAGLVVLLGLREDRPLLLPVVVVGGLATAGGLVLDATGWDAGSLAVTALTLVVIVGSVFPWLALGATSTRVDQIHSVADLTSEPATVEVARVRADARLAHQILVSVTASVGIVLVLVAPLTVGRGPYGAALTAVASLALLLRTRQYRVASEVRTGLASGLGGLASLVGSVLVLEPDWRPGVAIVLAAAGAVLLSATLVPTAPSVRRGRLGDVAETLCLVALLPLVVVASGLLTLVAELR